MEKIKFNKDDAIYDVNLTRIKSNVIKIASEKNISNKIITNGFVIINEFNNTIMSDYSDYTTIYLESGDEYYYLSTVEKYVEPTEPIVPTPSEPIIETLESVKNSKINDLNRICSEMITSGVDVEIDGNTEHFSYTIEDQANIDDIAQMAKVTKMDQSYHCDDGSCKLYTPEQIATIYMSQKMNKAHNITYTNQLKLYVKSLDVKINVESVSYGQDLTDEYLDTYNTIMEHEQAVAQAFIEKE